MINKYPLRLTKSIKLRIPLSSFSGAKKQMKPTQKQRHLGIGSKTSQVPGTLWIFGCQTSYSLRIFSVDAAMLRMQRCSFFRITNLSISPSPSHFMKISWWCENSVKEVNVHFVSLYRIQSFSTACCTSVLIHSCSRNRVCNTRDMPT